MTRIPILDDTPIKRRLPLLIGALLFLTVGMFTWSSYRVVRNSALDAGGQRLQSLTTQLSNLFQLSANALMARTFVGANEPATHSFLETPNENTKTAAVTALRQFISAEDQGNVQVELWRADGTLALVLPEGSAAESADLDEVFGQCAAQPFRTLGGIRFLRQAIVYPVVAAVRDDSGRPSGYLVRWRRLAAGPDTRKQLSDLLGNNASLFFGNVRGDIFSDLVKPVSPPPVGLTATTQPIRYLRDGHDTLGLGQGIGGTPWFMVVELPVSSLLEYPNRFLRRMLLMGVMVLGLGVVGAILFSRNITRPLQSLSEAATAISHGDFSRTVSVTSRDELGELAESFNVMVTRTREAQRELEHKVQERTLQLEAAPCAMLMVDQRGRMKLVNAQTEQLFGYERSELLDQPIEMLVPERYRPTHPDHRKIFSDHPTTRAMGAGCDLFGLRKDGSEVPIEIGLNPLETAEGSFVLASIINIVERKRAEERFRLVVEAAPNSMIMVNDRGLISLVNAQTERLFGYTRSELLGHPVEMLVPAGYRASHPDLRNSFFQQPSTRAR